MQVHRLSSTLVILMQFDKIPFTNLLSGGNPEELANRYRFRSVEVGQLNNGQSILHCQFGLFRLEKEYPITRLQIEERKIICELEAEKSVIDAFVEDLIDFLGAMSTYDKEEPLRPILVSNESEVVVQLDLDITSLFSPEYLRFIEDDVQQKVIIGNTSVRVRPAQIKFEVDYSTTDTFFQDNRITLSHKELLLQPRSGYSLEERMFASKAPLPSDLHIELLKKLEEIFRS
jgi:hypothetical protein